MQLRPKQQKMVDEVLALIAGGETKICVQAPTGFGKSVLFRSLARLLHERGHKPMVLADADHLIEQAYGHLTSEGLRTVEYRGNSKPDMLTQTVVSTVQSYVNRSPWDATVMMVDECHLAVAPTYHKIREKHPNVIEIGFTATPQRLDGKPLKEVYNVIVKGPQVRELIDDPEYPSLCDYRLFAAISQMKTAGVKVDRMSGDYQAGQLAELNDTADLNGDIVAAWEKHAYGKQTITFAINIPHAENIAEAYQSKGYDAAVVSSHTPRAERDELVARFRKGELKILVNCNIFTKGFDVPGVECVQICKPTKSLVNYLQSLGRGTRLAEGKDYLRIIEHTNNYIDHGYIDDDRVWSLEAEHEEREESKAERRKHKVCDTCQCLNKITALECINCGERFKSQRLAELVHREEIEIQQVQANRVIIPRVEDSPFLQALTAKLEQSKERGYKPGWAYYRTIEDDILPESEGALRAAAPLLGYKQSWAKFKWDDFKVGQKSLELVI